MPDEPNPNLHACLFQGIIVWIIVPVFPEASEYISLGDLSQNLLVSYLFCSCRCANHLVPLGLYKSGRAAPLYSTQSSLPVSSYLLTYYINHFDLKKKKKKTMFFH